MTTRLELAAVAGVVVAVFGGVPVLVGGLVLAAAAGVLHCTFAPDRARDSAVQRDEKRQHSGVQNIGTESRRRETKSSAVEAVADGEGGEGDEATAAPAGRFQSGERKAVRNVR